jgi:hypothetical protein
MKGNFINKDSCINELRNQGFIFYVTSNSITYFRNIQTKELAEINIYSDNSASALIGRFSE